MAYISHTIHGSAGALARTLLTQGFGVVVLEFLEVM